MRRRRCARLPYDHRRWRSDHRRQRVPHHSGTFAPNFFSRVELVALYQQHTDATVQGFTEEAIKLVWQFTQGQPWLVNGLAEQVVFKTKENLDRSQTIDLEQMKRIWIN